MQLLLCKALMKNPSCANQYDSLLKLFGVAGAEHGLRVRAYSPGTGAFSALHAKTRCVDEMVYIGCSLNFSKNAAANTEEHLVVLKDPSVVRTFRGWLDDLWFKGEGLSLESVAVQVVKQKEAKGAKKGPSRSPSVTRLVRHALSCESVPEESTAGVLDSVLVAVSSSPLASPGRADAGVFALSSSASGSETSTGV